MYTAPLGVGWMVTPHTHYGPAVDGYEYSKWGTYHFADRDGLGVDRTVATGTGFAGQYPKAWAEHVVDERDGTAGAAGGLRPGVARSGQHLLLPQVRRPRPPWSCHSLRP